MTIITGLKITKHKPKAWVLSSLQALLCTLLLTLLTACSALDRSSGFDSIKAYAYPGVTSLTQSSTGGFLLAWPKMPDSGATYSVYLRRSNLSEAYNFSTDPLLSATTTTADVAALPLNNTYCFVVRAQSNNYRTDSNVKEVCSGGDGVSDFTGIAAAVSMLSGQAVITWTPSSNINVTGYNIYQGSGMAVKITSAQPSVSSAVVSGLVPGQTIVFGVRAHDQYGREDDNTKTTSVVVSDAQMLAGTFPGCVSAAALNSNSVQVTVAFPAEATSMEVFRSGVSVGTVPIGKTTVVDVGLAEGGTYSYTCVAAIHSQPNLGATTVQAIIPYTSAPNFTGLKSVALTSTNGQVKLTWDNPGTGAAAAAFNVYMAPGPSAPTVNTDHLVATVTGDATSTVVSGLGGGIPYTFTVTACTTPTLCAGGTTSLTSNTLPSQGIPTTPGATLAAVSNGQIVITAPWTYQNGGISNRRIYRRNSSATNPVYITSSLGTFPYELLQTVPVSTAWAPPTLLTVTDVAANSTYYFIVRDESIDSPPYVSPNTSVVNVHTGTLTAPVFAGITSLTTGTSPESQLVVGFTAIAPEGSNTGAGQSLTGASNYNVYVTSAPPNNDGTPGTPSDSCNTSVVNRQISADSYHSGDPVNVTLAGLTSRYSYSVCVKAVNQENYVSVTTNSLTKTAQDLTPPVFYGIQSAKYNGNTNQIDLVWTPSTATDLLNYKISIAQGSQNTLLIKTPEQLSGVGRYSISSSDFAFTSGLVSVWVNACDNAAPLYGSSNNCTSYTVTNALMVSLPDLTPPSGFTGITSVTNTSPNATGSVLVNWAAPSSWFDVYGFNVYDVSNTSSPTLLKNCICTNVSGNTNGALGTCASANTSCTLNNLNAGRTYKFYVRAYNSANVETYLTNPNPITNNITFKTTNLVAPVFASNLAGYFANGSGIALNWNAATSNQYTGAPDNNTINYKIYRMQAASTPTFSNLAVPGNQVAQVTTVTNYTDPLAGLTDAVTYYYTICASDSNGNSTCDGVIQGITTPNMTPPTLSNIAGSRNLLTSSQPTFQLSWSMTDKATPTNQIVIAVRKKTTATSATDYPCTPLRFAASACGTVDSVYQQSAGLLSLANETGPANTNTWITYSLTATDTANNSKDYFFAIQSVLAPLATSIGSPSSSVLNSSGTTTFPVTYSVPNGSSATVTSVVANSGWWIAAGNNTNYVTVNTVTGNATCFVTVSGASLTSRNLALSNCTGNGTVTVSIATGTATDSNGNASSIAGPSATITVDNAAPTPTISIPVSNAYTNSTSNFAVSGACEAGLSVTISGSGVQTPTTVSCASGTYSGTITLASGDGTKAITVSQTDVAGNTGTSAATSINLLTTLPVVTITSPISGAASNTGGILFTGTCKSGLLVYFSGTGVPTTETTACTGGAYSQFVTFSAGDGSKTIAVSQTDLASNTSLPLSVSVVADTTAPVVTIGSPSSAAVNTNTAVNYTLSFGDGSGSGVAAVNMSLSNITVATTGTASCTSALTGSGLSTRTVTLSSCSGNGTVAMSVAAGVVTDNAGNNSILTGPSASFSVNNTAPTPTIVVPASSAYVNSASNLTVSGTCASGYNVIIAGTGVATGATVTCPSGTFSGSVSLVTGDGSKNITISQTDAVGNAGGANRSINLLTIAPTVTISAPAANTPTNTGALTFTGSCVAPPVGTNVSFTGAGVTSTQTTSCASDGSYSKVVTLSSSDGTKSVSVSQTDLAGNTSTPVSVSVISDTTPPAIAFGSPSHAAVNNSTSVTYAVNFSDTGGSGVVSISVTASNVTLTTTGNATCTIAPVSGSGLSTRTVTLSSCTGNGTVAINVAAGVATDNATNTSVQTGPSGTFTVNNTPPAVAITSPASNAYVASTSVTVSGTCTSTYTVTIAGSGVTTGATPVCSSGTYSAGVTLTSGDGTKTITASQTDSLGNVGTASQTINLLTTAPVVTLTAPATNTSTNSGALTFTGACKAGLLVYFSGGVSATQTTSCASDGSYSKVVTLSSSDGTKSVSVSQTDLAGNTSTPVSVNVIADTTPPAIAFGSPSSASVNSSTTVTYAVNFSDTGGSGVASVNMSTSDVSLATTGSTTCTISGVTGSGLSTRTVSLSNCTGNGSIAIRLAAGIATDNASNSSAQTSYSNTFTVNNTPPSVAINSPSANAYTASTSVTVSGTCTSTYTVTIAGSGVATGATPSCSSGTYSANITLVTGDGSKTITASQTDSVGNIGTATRTVNLLTTAPVVTVSSPIPNMATNASSILFGGNCTSGLLVYFSGAGVSTTQTASCTSGTYSSFVTLSSGDGTKTVSIAQTDLAGNTSLALSVSVIKDTIAPTITFGTPSLSYANSSTSVSIATNFTDGGSGMASVNISTSNISLTTTDTATCTVASVTGTGTASRTVMLSSCSGDGTVAINVAAGVATDNASNASALTGPSSTFTVDNTAPTITITSPSNNSYTNSTSVTVSGACESGLTVTLAGSGLTATNTTSCTSGAYSKSVTLVSGDGTKSFTASQTDAAGNTGTTSALTINLLQTPPTVTITSPTVTTATNSGLLFTGSCKTGLAVVFSGSGVLNSPVIGSACASSSYSQYVTLTGSNGAKTVTVSQTDEASNVGSASVSVTFDTVKPALIISSPSLSAANSSKTISYTLSFSDTAGSGVASVSLSTSNITLNTTGTSCTKSVGGSGTSSRTVTLTNCTGDGTASITVAAGVATDNASNTSLAAGPSATFTVANTPPTLSVTSPAANSTYSTSFTLAGTCQTGLTVTVTSAGISGSPVSTTCVAGAFSQGITLTGSDGSKTLTISEQDAAENTASTTLTVVRDSTAPSVAITSPANNTGLSSTSVTVPLTGTCETGLTVILGGNVPAGQTTTCASGTFTFSSWQINSGTSPYSVSVNVSQLDAAGNLGTSSSKTYNIDTTQVLPGYVSTVTSAAVSNTYFVNFTGTCMSGTDAGGSSYTTTATTSAGVVTGITCASNVLTIQVGMFTTGGSQSITVTPTTTRNANNATATSSASFTASPSAMLAFNTQTVPAGLHATFTGTCYSGTDLGGSGYTYASTTTLGTVARTTCSGGVLTVQVGGFTTGGPRTFTITTTATRTASSATATLTSASLEQYFSCPPNYVGVPGKWSTDTDTAGLGSTSATAGNATATLDPTLDFCVMKYHAKNSVGYYATTTGFQTYYWFDPAPLSIYIGGTSSYIFPQSRPDGIPIYNNQMAYVATWCTALNYGNGLCTSANCSPTSNGVTYGYQPMSNTEWQVIARNLESVGANWSSATWSSSTKAWSGGTVGTGSLWRGHTDGNVSNYSDSNLFGITYGATSNSAGNLALSAPKLDTGISDYFGTDGSASINAQERRRFVLSTGDSIWDMAGNISQYLTDTRSGMGLVNNTCGTYELTSTSYPTASDLLLLGSLGGYTSAKNAGKVYNCGFPVLARGGAWNDASSAGLFSANTTDLANRTSAGTAAGIRCVYIPPPTTVLNANTVTVAVSRTDTVGNNLASNASVTIANGGTWNLGVTVTDSGYSGPNSNLIYIQVYRKITNSPTDFPTTSSSVYYAGYPAANAAPFLLNETAWTRAYNSGLGQYTYTKNDGTYVNYLVIATDPTGAVGTATYSVSNTQSCPPGYVGVPDGTATYHNNMSGLGNSSASAGNSNAQLDPSRPFCMMKYSAKALAAGTTAAQNRIGEVFYPLPWGQSSTTKYASLNTYSTSYTSTSFDSNILIIPESRAADIPWVNISQSDSVNACRSLQMQYFGSSPDTSTGTGFQLMSNTEWQVMARNIESTTGNWSTGTVGFGLLNRGLSNGNLSTLLSNGLPTWWGMAASTTPSAPMSSSWNDNNGFFMLGRPAASASAIANAYWPTIGVSASSDQEKRTFNLSNGAIVWDIAGNAWNWVSDTVSSLGISSAINPGSNSWLDFNNATFGTRGSPTADSLAFGGYLLATSNSNSGMVYTGGNTALARGNYYTSASSGATSGVFSATTQFSTNDSSNVNVGFRCVYVPSTVNQPVVKSVVSAGSPNTVTSTFTGGSAASVGQIYYWTITGGGISAADFSQPASSPMAGSFVLDSNLQASVIHQLTASGTAGTRSLSFNVYSDSGYTTQVGITQTIQLTRVANTKLLVNGTGSNGGSTITDSSTIGATATVTNVTTSTAAGLFASSSMAFGGTNNYVSFPDNSNYAIGTNAFTLELWANFSSVGSAYKGIVSKPGGATCTTDANGFLLMLDNSFNKIAFLAGNGSWSVNLNSGTAPIANTWLHIAVTRDSSNVWRLFLNGALKASTTNTLNLTNPACPLYLGKYPNFPSYATTMDFGGYMSDMRFIVGSALYTSNFTPPQLQLGAAAAAVLINNTP